MKSILKFIAGLLATLCITAIVGLVPTLFWHGFFDFVLLEGLNPGKFVFWGQPVEGVMLFDIVTVRSAITFAIVAVIIYNLQGYWASHATMVILAWCFPVLVSFEALCFKSLQDGRIFLWMADWMNRDPLYRATWLWTLALWIESIVVEVYYKAFDTKHWRSEFWVDWVTSSGVSTIYYIILSTIGVPVFSRTAYTLLPIMALHQFALAKRKSIKAKKKPAAPSSEGSGS